MKCITIIGNLGANAVRRMTSDGKELMTFNIAVNQPNADPLWFNCVGNMREKLFPYLVKGQCVCVIGDLSAGVYNTKIDLSVNVEKCELCGAKPDQSSQQSPQQTTQEPTPVESFDAANMPEL